MASENSRIKEIPRYVIDSIWIQLNVLTVIQALDRRRRTVSKILLKVLRSNFYQNLVR